MPPQTPTTPLFSIFRKIQGLARARFFAYGGEMPKSEGKEACAI
jgi:hypothetical protein